MNELDQDRMRKLLQQALPPIEGEPEPARDLWPAVLRRLDEKPAAPPQLGWVLFDWALAAGLALLVTVFPASIPVLLYYL
jgi:anti-sigma factor RsiW